MKQPSLKYSLLIIIVTFGIVTVPVIVLGISVQPLFLLSLAAAIPLCMRLGYSFAEIQSGMTEYSKRAFSPILFMLAVGAMTGVWNSCGTIAEITKLGINLVSPSVFLPACFLLCMIFALFTGTAFGTCGTVGLALIVMSAS
ncbi:MAG: sodium:proton antiporter, partial [Oscillospiraceae bacterium]|nr:sodium:proton antiporter [Oscillospiraceae bacterium]